MNLPERKVPLPAPLVQQIGDYLAQRPYREVAGLLGAMQEAVDAAAQTQGVPPAPPVRAEPGASSGEAA